MKKGRFEAMDLAFVALQAMPLHTPGRKAGIQRLKNAWDQLRDEAVNGDRTAQHILQALWVNRMYEELVNPRLDKLIRFDDAVTGTVLPEMQKKGATRSRLVEALQGRTLMGLYCYYDGFHKDNPFLGEPRRFVRPTMAILAKSRDERVHAWGQMFMSNLIPQMTKRELRQHVRQTARTFFATPPGELKFSLMHSLKVFADHGDDESFWRREMLPWLHRELDQLSRARSPGRKAGQKYVIALLAQLEDRQFLRMVRPLLHPKAHPDTQRAIAWGLGRFGDKHAFDLLHTMIGDSRYDPLAREMAVYSLAEYKSCFPRRVKGILRDLADQELPKPTPDEETRQPEVWKKRLIKEAALAMLEKHEERLGRKDFYIKRFLKSPVERRLYRKFRKYYVKGFERLNTTQKNLIDRILIPYMHHVPVLVLRDGVHTITTGAGGVTDTPEYRSDVCTRYDDGRLADTVTGIASPTAGAVTSALEVDRDRYNQFAHEFGHHLHQLILDRRRDKGERITGLYKAAKNEGRVLDYYGATDAYEYFAQGVEAMDQLYKSHYYYYLTLFQDGYHDITANTRSKLKRRDPELYRLLLRESYLPVVDNLFCPRVHPDKKKPARPKPVRFGNLLIPPFTGPKNPFQRTMAL